MRENGSLSREKAYLRHVQHLRLRRNARRIPCLLCSRCHKDFTDHKSTPFWSNHTSSTPPCKNAICEQHSRFSKCFSVNRQRTQQREFWIAFHVALAGERWGNGWRGDNKGHATARLAHGAGSSHLLFSPTLEGYLRLLQVD